MEQKFFFFDVDNTLIAWPTGIIPESTKYALNKLQEAGHKVALATGRLQADAAKYAKLAHMNDFVADGGYSVTADNRIVLMRSLDIKKCQDFIAQLDTKNVPWAIATENKTERYTRFSHLRERYAPWDHFSTVHVPDLDYRKAHEIYKIFVYLTPLEQDEANIDLGDLEYIRYGEDSMLVEPMDKAWGIRKMADHYGIPYENVVTFGDGNNDIRMFHPQWTNIAMGNGRSELKKLADYVTDDCDKDGILKACLHFGWVTEA